MSIIVKTKADLNTQILQNENHIKVVSHGRKYFAHYSSLFNELEYRVSKLAKFVIYEESELDGLQFYYDNCLIKVDCGIGNTEIIDYELTRDQFVEIIKVVYMAAVNGRKVVFMNELRNINF
ncbi:Component of the U4/U6.U5 snRNP/mitosis protein DIM1 [Trachipleistophora hominis]|uniref:Component of the U4/U6.U5 snRNP/mitosis protein DIM1 n=1 Tax=Trachipleistophora hominis TaxID=72359 RepID=L7JTD8_TRAHO|nr:Component of the U4/U6.U5 snRNP/mitosis protein DIM1 [Trachipleistophora hominis]